MKTKSFDSNDYRHELKYVITDNDFVILKHRLNAIMKMDNYCLDNHYKITSIYFDNYKKTSFYQVLNGISERWKYRIRFYNNDDSYIVLEKKYKINSMTKKTSVKITKEMFDDILHNRNIHIQHNQDKLLNEFYLKMKTEMLKPMILIEYDRIPYVYKLGNTRVTIDYNIGYNKNFSSCFKEAKKLRYLEEKVLEVKYNGFIPDFIRYKLELNHLIQTSFSKFKNCCMR